MINFIAWGQNVEIFDLLIAEGADIKQACPIADILLAAKYRKEDTANDVHETWAVLSNKLSISTVEEWRDFGYTMLARLAALCERQAYNICNTLEERNGTADMLSAGESILIDWGSLTPARAEALIKEERLDPQGLYAGEGTRIKKPVTPIMKVVQNNGDPDVIDVFVRYGTDINWQVELVSKVKLLSKEEKHVERFSALDYALHFGYVNLTQRLLELGANIHSQGKFGDPPAIFYAASNPELDLDIWERNIDLLLSHGADINAFDYFYQEDNLVVHTPLMYAIKWQIIKEEDEEKYTALISYMVSRGAAINIQPPDGLITAMHLAVLARTPAVVETLLRLGGDVNLTIDKRNCKSPLLYFAVFGQSIDILDLLVAEGADIKPECSAEELLAFAGYRKTDITDDVYDALMARYGNIRLLTVTEWRDFGYTILVRLTYLCRRRSYDICDTWEEYNEIPENN